MIHGDNGCESTQREKVFDKIRGKAITSDKLWFFQLQNQIVFSFMLTQTGRA